MNLQTLLDHTSQADRDAMLRTLLTAGYSDGEGGEVDLDSDEEIPGADFVATFCEAAQTLRKKAEANIAELAKVKLEEEGSLDDLIHDTFSSKASDLNNGGNESQAQYLIVEEGYKAETINASADGAGDRPMREIPE